MWKLFPELISLTLIFRFKGVTLFGSFDELDPSNVTALASMFLDHRYSLLKWTKE